MALTLGDKTFRTIRFLVGLRNPRIATALASYGFKQDDMVEGWDLINALGRGKLAFLPAGPRDTATLLKLDAWENQWFPIAQAALERRFPAVSARFFLNLVQTEGPEVAITVRTFVERYAELVAGDDKYGADAKSAQQLLAKRGVTPDVVAEATGLLTQLTHVAEPADPISTDEQEAELEKAEAAMWAFYLEWSKIARIAIKQRPLLRQLGFLNSTRRPTEDEEEDEVPASPTTPATAQTPST